MQTGKVLVTGGAGFIGSRLVSKLCQEGMEALVADVLHPQVHQGGRPSALPASANLIPLDVTHGPTWDALFRLFRPDVVIHLAAETGTGQSLLESTRHGMVNVVGTTQLLDAMARAGHVPSHLILSSSRAVYGEGEWEADGESYYPGPRARRDLAAGHWDPPSPSGKPGHAVPSAAGRTRTEPTSVYGATKLTQEHALKAWSTAHGCSLSILRFQNVYGVGQSLSNPYTGVLTLFAQMALQHARLPVYEDGVIVRDFVYVEDVVDALWSALCRPPDAIRLLDIGSGSATTILEAATAMAAHAGAPEPEITGAFRDGDVRAAMCDVSDARRELGYDPRWTLPDGLGALLDWVGDETGGRESS